MLWRFICATVLITGFGGTVLMAGQITVTGRGDVNVAPDMATLNLGVTSQARTAAAALAANATAAANVFETLRQAGIAARDMQTSDLSLQPAWSARDANNQSPPQIVGYRVFNQVQVRVRDLSDLGNVLDQIVADGATNFNGLTFGLQNQTAAMDVARQDAVIQARRKAQLYADAAGVNLGDLLDLSEAPPPGPVLMREMSMADAVPVAEGELTISASVTLVYDIAN